LKQFAEKLRGTAEHKSVSLALEAWAAAVRRASWANAAELKQQFGNASLVGDRVVFNIHGNRFRLVVGVNYHRRSIYIKWFGSHAEYDAIDVRTVEYER
jgi:mRNA interferase HigB